MKLQHPERLKTLQQLIKKDKNIFRQLPMKGVAGEKVNVDLRKIYSDEQYAALLGREEDKLETWEVCVFLETDEEIEGMKKWAPVASIQIIDLDKGEIIFQRAIDKRPKDLIG